MKAGQFPAVVVETEAGVLSQIMKLSDLNKWCLCRTYPPISTVDQTVILTTGSV